MVAPMGHLRYLSVCSGIEAASVAWHPLGWRPAAFAEIEPFPCAVLHFNHLAGRPMFMPDPSDPCLSAKDRKARAAAIRAVQHLPEAGPVPNFGDMTQFQRWPDAAFDVLVGGTPCQDYSVAGLRLGMAGSRGQLTLTYVEIAARYRPRWVVWENVPGVLSSNGGRDFARFLGDLSGQSIAVPEGGWQNAGIVSGIPDAYGLTWRVLDAQFVRTRRFLGAVPQRRRRVFVVGCLGDWRRAAAVLFDGESLRGNPPPRREAGQRPAPTLAARTRGGGGLGTDFDLDGGLISMAHGQGGAEIGIDHGPTLTCNHEAPIVAHALRAEGFDASEDGTGRGTPIVPVCFDVKNGLAPHGRPAVSDVAFPLKATDVKDPQIVAFGCLAGGNTGLSFSDVPGALHGGGKSDGRAAIAIQERAVSENPNVGPDGKGWRDDGAAYTLEARPVTQAVAFSCKDHGADSSEGVAPTMRAMGHGASHANAGGQLAVAFAENSRAELRLCGGDGAVSSQLTTGGGKPGQGQPTIALPWAVRRLTPVECERLQGFPDDYTQIPWRGKNDAPDGPRYKALGNSMAVNVMEWIGSRINMVDAISLSPAPDDK